MSGSFCRIHSNDKAVQQVLSDVAARCRNLKPAMKIIGIIMTKSVRENFVAEGRPAKWQRLATSTLLSKVGGRKGFKKNGEIKDSSVRKLGSNKILQGLGMNGGLMASIHYVYGDTDVEIGTDKEYGAVHQFGIDKKVTATRKSKTVFGTQRAGHSLHQRHMKIPARPYLLVQEEDKSTIIREVSAWITRNAK
jgi:phage gpG-like protein